MKTTLFIAALAMVAACSTDVKLGKGGYGGTGIGAEELPPAERRAPMPAGWTACANSERYLISNGTSGGKLARFNSVDGTFDRSFGKDGVAQFPSLSFHQFLSCRVAKNGDVIVAGHRYDSPVVIRVVGDGFLNPNYGDSDSVLQGGVTTLAAFSGSDSNDGIVLKRANITENDQHIVVNFEGEIIEYSISKYINGDIPVWVPNGKKAGFSFQMTMYGDLRLDPDYVGDSLNRPGKTMLWPKKGVRFTTYDGKPVERQR